MSVVISPYNFIYILAYAFDLNWNYLEKEVLEEDIFDLSYFELLTFLLTKWTERLIKEGLYKSFVDKCEEIKKIKGKILFMHNIKSFGFYRGKIHCQFDDFSFDTIENQILLSTLKFCDQELDKKVLIVPRVRRKRLKELSNSVFKLARLLFTQISFVPLSDKLFDQLLFHRMNIRYRPIMAICKFIYNCALIKEAEGDLFLDIPEERKSEIFERFLRNYLAEQLYKEGLRVESMNPPGWIITEEGRLNPRFPGMHPDIVIKEKGRPIFVIDAKFYESPVYRPGARFSVNEEEEKDDSFKTHSNNLYQLLAYTDYFNCDGLLVYAQTEEGFFHETGRLDPKYYHDSGTPSRKFGFFTLDLSGDIEEFRLRMENFTHMLVRNIKNKINGKENSVYS